MRKFEKNRRRIRNFNLRLKVYKEQDRKCYYCQRVMYLPDDGRHQSDERRRDAATWDHKQPVSIIAKSLETALKDMSNLVLACRRCNNLKGDLTEEQFRSIMTFTH